MLYTLNFKKLKSNKPEGVIIYKILNKVKIVVDSFLMKPDTQILSLLQKGFTCDNETVWDTIFEESYIEELIKINYEKYEKNEDVYFVNELENGVYGFIEKYCECLAS